MLESLVITLREGIEAALVVGIILTYLRKTNRAALNKWVYWGLGAAVIASLALGIGFKALNISADNDFLEGVMFGVAGILVASLVVWMWRVSKSMKREVETKLGTIVSQENLRNQGLGLLGFTFFMVFREGAETVLFLMGASLGRFDWLSFLGGCFGLGLAVLFAVFFIRGSLRMNLSRFFAVTSVVLLILAIKLILSSLHGFAEAGVLQLTPTMMVFIGFFVKDNTSTIILITLLMIPLLVILWDARNREVIPPGPGESTVERRKRLAKNQQASVWRLSLVAISLVIFFSTGWVALASPSYSDRQPIPIASDNSEVRIPLAGLPEGKLVKYVYNAEGTQVRFILFKQTDGSISTALDACKICGKVGYGQGKDTLLCKRCNAPIAYDTIDLGGGCNPIPLTASLSDGAVVIPVDELVKAEPIFK